MPNPGDPQSLNRYTYTLNNPLRYTDPSGHCIPGKNCLGDNNSSGGTNTSPTTNQTVATTTSTPAPQQTYWALGKNEKWWASQHRFQGYNTPDCGPTSLAMILNGLSNKKRDKTDVNPKRWWIIKATEPQDIATEFNSIASTEGLNYSAEVKSGASKDDLVDNLQKGNPVTALVQFTVFEGHYVDVIGYDPNSDEIYYLDPANSNGGVDKKSWQDFNDGPKGDFSWSKRAAWNEFRRNVMIVYHQ